MITVRTALLVGTGEKRFALSALDGLEVLQNELASMFIIVFQYRDLVLSFAKTRS
jgi:hypothetical protein